MNRPEDATEQLIQRAQAGDDSAAQELLMMYRERLRRMIAVRIDPRISARIDPSDVVQEALIDASRKLPNYLEEQPISFYPWLRRIAWERLVHLHTRHIEVQKRSIKQEARRSMQLPDLSVMQLVGKLAAKGSSPSEQVASKELRARVRLALEELSDKDREVLVLRYLEQLSTDEIADIMLTSKDAVKTRHFRAIQRLQNLLKDEV
jgi:RNA polymerase sigma-70 factor (ECF subfamily)